MKSTPKAVIYCRVSSSDQAENGTSLESQEQACLQKAVAIDSQVVAPVFRDEGISGATLIGRPGLQAALSMIESGKANVLICYDVSRLSRDVEHHAVIERRVKAARGRIIYCTQDFADTADGELSSGILKQFAQWEKRKIRERTMSGHKRQAEKGIQTFRNLSPLGYHIVTQKEVLTGQYLAGTQGKYLIVEDEAVIVRELFRRAFGGASLTALVKWLNESGVPTRQGGARWYAVTVRAILNNPVYKGEAMVGRKEVVMDESRREKGLRMSYYLRDRAKENCIRIEVPALVEANLWEFVQQRLLDNKARISGRTSRRFTFTGLFRCPVCSKRCGASHKKGTAVTYTCRNKRYCHPHGYGGRTAERAVYAILCEIIRRPELVEAALNAYDAKRGVTDTAGTRDALLKELSKLQQREKATVTAQIAGIQAGADPSVYDSIFAEIGAKRKELQQRLAGLEVSEQVPVTGPKDRASIFSQAIADVEIALLDEGIDPVEKNVLLSSVVKAVYPINREGDYRITLVPLPGSGVTVQQELS